jgi:hypothetical protein
MHPLASCAEQNWPSNLQMNLEKTHTGSFNILAGWCGERCPSAFLDAVPGCLFALGFWTSGGESGYLLVVECEFNIGRGRSMNI